MIRDAVRGIFEASPDITVVCEADNGRDAVDLACEKHPDIAVVDITMHGLNGIDVTRQIAERCPGVRVVILSMHSSRQFVSQAFQAGAQGYVVKESGLDEVEEAVRTVASGEVFLSQSVAHVLVDDYVRHLTGGPEETVAGTRRPLSPREREVLQLTAEGHTTKEIASVLHLSGKTVESHRRNIMDKTGIFSLAGLVKYAIREGLATLDD